MHATTRPRPKPKSPARLQRLAGLWLACIAALLTCAAYLLPPAHRRRLPVLDLPRTVFARLVARLILICALEHAVRPKNLAQMRKAGAVHALLRAGVQRHLTNAHGAYDLAKIARTCAHPERAIADMIAALKTGLTRRAPILRAPHSMRCPRSPRPRSCRPATPPKARMP